jgi:hypothetical protein
MHKKIFLLALLTVPGLAFGKVIMSREFAWPPERLRKLESSLQQAFERDEEMQKYLAYYKIDEANNVSLGCGPQLPDKDGKGCVLNFVVAIDKNSSIGMSKKLLVKGKAQLVEDTLKKVDPNTTEEHQHFGSIFEIPDTYGSHYFCQPEGDAGKKKWGCYLYVSESLN